MTLVGKGDAPGSALPLGGRETDELADQARARWIGKARRDHRHQRIDTRVARQLLLLQIPDLAEAVVPEVQAAVGGEHAHRLVEIVESGRPHAQQRVRLGAEADLLGPVLEDHQHTAVG